MGSRDETTVRPTPAGSAADATLARIEGRLRGAWFALLFERLWPAIQPILGVAALFLIASFFGLWAVLDGGLRLAALAVFAVAGLIALSPIVRLRPPSRADAVARLDATVADGHRPLRALSDTLAAGRADPGSDALWRVHLERQARRAEAVAVERPRPAVPARDRFGVRAALALVLAVAFVAADGRHGERVGEAFRGASAPEPPVAARIDVWVTPPAYTGRAPLFLTADRPADEVVRVPQGSLFQLRTDRPEAVSLSLAGVPVAAAEESGGAGAGFRVTLDRDAVVILAQRGHPERPYRFAIDPDRVPAIAIDGRVQETAGGAVRVRYRLEDDFGVIAARAEFEPPGRAEGPPALMPRRTPRPLVGAPEMPLRLPQARVRAGTDTTTRDLTAHPWAGARVRMTLVARDDAGQEGRSETVVIELPQRAFQRPIARALVEQRRTLAMDAGARDEVQAAIALITLDPLRRAMEARTYLALRTVYFRLANATEDADLVEVLDALWQVALSIEDGDLSDAERRLRDVQDRLERALEQGASDEEIRRLMEELRQAMQDFMRELAERALREQREGRDQQQQQQRSERTITQQDLERMLRDMENMARSGARQAARDMLNQLRDMMNALRNSRPQFGQDGGEQQDMLDELGNMIREQQRLMDQTFRERQQRQQQGRQGQQQGRQGQQGRQPGQQGQQGQQGGGEPGGEGDQAMNELRQGQGALRQRLQEMLDQLRQGGREGNRDLGEAGDSMGRAEQQLGRGDPGNALGQQGRALDGLRRGAQQMMREMMGEGDQAGEGGPGGPQPGQNRNTRMADPLQRNSPFEEAEANSDVRVPGQGDLQRAQRILEEVRRRLSDPSRPRLELDYLQRLLRPF